MSLLFSPEMASKYLALRYLTITTWAFSMGFGLSNATAVAAELEIENVVVAASRSDQVGAGRTASSFKIDEKLITRTAAVHANEIIQRVPGAWLSRGNGQESLTAIRSPVLTGAGSCGAFLVAEDGVATRATGFCNVNQLFDINTEQAGAIEVLRGSGNDLHGANALHGVINVLSRAPSAEAEQTLGLEVGANDYHRGSYTASNTIGEHAYRISVNGASDGGQKDNTGFDQQKLSFRHDYNGSSLSIKNLLSLTNLNQETAGFVEGFEAYRNPANLSLNPQPEAFRDTQSLRFQSSIHKQLSDDSELLLTPYIRSANMTFLMHFLPGTPLESNRQKSAGIQSTYTRHFNNGHRLSAGVDAELAKGELQQTQEFGFSSFPAGRQFDYEVDAQSIAGFINSAYQLRETTTLSSSLRWEHLAYDYDNFLADGNLAEDGSQCINGFTGAVGCRYSRPADRRDSFTNTSVDIGLVHHLSDTSSFEARVARGYRPPQTSELYRLQEGQSVSDVNSEQLDSIEFGFQVQQQQWAYSLSVYGINKDNVIIIDAQRRYINSGKTVHYGLEYALNVQLSQQWQLNVAGQYARHKYRDNISAPGVGDILSKGNDIDTAPKTLGSAQLAWTPNSDNRLELEWVHIGKYFTNIANTRSYEGHDLVNVVAHHSINDQLRLGLRIKNVLDTRYAERADVTFGDNDDRYFIGEPRSVFADLRWSF